MFDCRFLQIFFAIVDKKEKMWYNKNNKNDEIFSSVVI